MDTLYTCKIWEPNDLPYLLSYLDHLDIETRSRFGPHAFTAETLLQLYHSPAYKGFLLIENRSTYIIGYAIIRLGYFEHDLFRFHSYSYYPDYNSTAMYAPSLALEWRNKGLGKILWHRTEDYLKQVQVKKVLLWGGVQENNLAAVHYYKKLGFETLGRFEMNSIWNLDMFRSL